MADKTTAAVDQKKAPPPPPSKAAPTNKGTAPGGNAAADTADQGAEGEGELPPEGRMLSRQLVWGLTAGGSSMVVHLAGLLVMGLMMLPNAPRPEPKTLEAAIPPPPAQEEITQKLEKKIEPSQTLAPASTPSSAASATVGVSGAISAAVTAPKLNTTVVNRPTSMRVDVGAVSVFTQSGATFAAAVPEGTLGDGLSTAKDYGDAMDRITQEILNMLAKGKVMVVWGMDQSESMQDDRDEIMARIDRVYTELGLSATAKDDALLTGVISYGKNIINHTPKPSYNPVELAAAFKAVPVDPTGFEMQADVVLNAMNTFGPQAAQQHRQMAMIIVSDESGDADSNIARTEAAIQACQQAKCKVFVLGREAIFGYPYAYMRYTHPETKTLHWLRIDRGPETPQPEQLQINGFHRRYDAFPSGFGPFEQSRMARQTGGIFFMLPSPEVNLHGRLPNVVYDADAMRPYLPDLSARVDYMTERDKSDFRKIIFKVISDLNPYGPRGNQVEVKTDQFPIERAAFATEANTQMKKAEVLIKYLKEAQTALESVASYRAREKSPRWRANYDLIYAQVISYQSRLQEYGWYLALFIQNPKPIKNPLGAARQTNGWDIATVPRMLKEDVTKENRDKADELFRAIEKEYAGTPWAARATEELRRGYGVDLHEDYEDPRGRGIQLPKL